MRKRLRVLAAAAAAFVSGCAHNRYAEGAAPLPRYLASLNAHDQQMVTTGYRLAESDSANALYRRIRNSGRPESSEAEAAATPEVKTEIVNLPVPEFQDADGTIKRAHLERVRVVK